MGTYLKDGWFEHSDSQKLRSDVIDGAMDLAGSFLRANVSAQTLQDIALKARASFTLIDPQMRGGVELTAADRERIIDRLGIDPAGPPELYAFVADCVEHLQEPRDILGLYLHLTHISRMVELLSQATTQDTSTSSR